MINMFFDECQRFDTHEEIFQFLQLYENISASMNEYGKDYRYVLRQVAKYFFFNQIKWSKRHVKAVGVQHTNGVDIDQMWLEKMN